MTDVGFRIYDFRCMISDFWMADRGRRISFRHSEERGVSFGDLEIQILDVVGDGKVKVVMDKQPRSG